MAWRRQVGNPSIPAQVRNRLCSRPKGPLSQRRGRPAFGDSWRSRGQRGRPPARPTSKALELGTQSNFRRSRSSRRHRRRRTRRSAGRFRLRGRWRRNNYRRIHVEFTSKISELRKVTWSKVPEWLITTPPGPGNISTLEKRGRSEGEISVVACERVGDRGRRRGRQ